MMYEPIISKTANIGINVEIKPGVVIEDDVCIGDNSYIDYGAIIKKNVSLGKNSFVGANSILGEFLADFYPDMTNKTHELTIGEQAIIRSGTIIYGDTKIGSSFQTGHRATIREKSIIGNNVSIGTLSDLQGYCELGDYVHLHSNVHLGQKSIVRDYAWIFPYVVLTNDPTPPSEQLVGVEVFEYACICTGAIVLPGIKIGKDALIGAGAIVTKDVEERMAVIGNPAKPLCRVDDIKGFEGNNHYPWRDYFKRGMPWE